MKVAKACWQCRVGKRRCVIATERGVACLPCQKRKFKCSLARQPQMVQRIAPSSIAVASHSSATDDSLALSLGEVTEFVELYLRFVHDRPHSIFHEKTLWEDIRACTLPKCLLAAICALGFRFSTRGHDPVLGARLRKTSSSLFSQQLETISLANVQTCILLANVCASESDNALEALYFSIANRMSHILGLFKTNTEDPPIVREIKCRIAWTLFMADRWCLPGLGLSREITNFEDTLDLPMDEAAFQRLDGVNRVEIHNRKHGVWTYKVTLVDILGPIQDLNQSLVHNIYSRQALDETVANLAGRLRSWLESLPAHMSMNDHNLNVYRDNHQGGTLVALHLGYHHYSTLLYFQFLDTASQTTSQAKQYACLCRFHALSFSRLLHSARNTDDCHVVYLTVAHMTLVSSSVLLHTLLFGEDDQETQTARLQLTRNFEALIDLKKYWPHMETITRRLLTFQESCLRSAGDKTHVVDKWMIRFLLEHALPLSEKGLGDTVFSGNDDEQHMVIRSLPAVPGHEIPPERTDMLNLAFTGLLELN